MKGCPSIEAKAKILASNFRRVISCERTVTTDQPPTMYQAPRTCMYMLYLHIDSVLQSLR